jgi:ABC-2 type transport system ATP-binding protein
MPEAVPQNAISIRGLAKIYRAQGRQAEKQALTSIDLDVPTGSRFGLLGPNGAGKSTLINILAGLVLKTAGSASIWDCDIDADPRRSRSLIGVVPQELNMDPFFTPRQVLDLQAGLYGVPRSQRRTMEILETVGLADKADAYARTLSGGMRRRLMVGKAMVHAPPVLVLDEPTAGVDIELRQHLWAHVRELNRRGTTIVLTTHYLEEAQELCDRIAIIADGKLAACDTTENLLHRVDGKELIIATDAALTQIPEGLAVFDPQLLPPNRLLFRYRRSETKVAQILAAASAAGIGIVDLSSSEADLEDIFLQLTHRALPAEAPA